MPSRPTRSVTSAKSGKFQTPNQVVLDRVLGFTLINNCALSLNLTSGVIAYAAGCVVVLRSFDRDQQRFIQSSNKKSITAVDFSPDGKFIATGESGHQPMVRVWSVSDGAQLAEFAGHHFRVIAVRFSPSTRYLVSLGSQEDNSVYVWDRMGGQRIASAKVTNKINGVAFSPNGQFFVTVGVRHVRYWYLETRRGKNKETIPLNGRNAILGDLLNNSFMDVCCVPRTPNQFAPDASSATDDSVSGETLTLVVSKAGQLMQFSEQRYLDKWVELRTSRATCLSVHGPWVVVGCARGVCLLFECESLQFLTQIPMPHQLGSEVCLLSSLPQSLNTSHDSTDAQLFADLLAVKLDRVRSRVVCFYADHSVYTWNIVDLSNVHRLSAHFYHSRGVWCVDCMSLNPTRRFVRHRDVHTRAADPTIPLWWSDSTFVTCADDGTIRFWDLTEQPDAHNDDPMAGVLDDSEVVRAANSQTKEELVRIIFTDSTHKFVCVGDRPCAELTYAKFEVGVGPVGSPSPLLSTSAPNDSAAPSPSSPTVPSLGESMLPGSNSSSTNGCCVRTICISPDYRHLAAGDRDGNLRVYALTSLEQVFQITAHDSEILSLNFFRSHSVPELMLLCSASRDRLIHIFDPNQGYSLVQTVADHSAAIFAAHIVETEEDGEIRLISCGMDKSLLIRVLEPDETGLTARFSLEHHLVGRHSQLDAAFTPSIYPSTAEGKSSQRKRYLAVACQDRRLRIYNVTTGRQVRCYRGSFNEDGCLVRCAIDPTGSIVATSGSDKQMNVFHLLSGESIATLFGHSELALGLRFLPNLRHLITVSSDSCIFVWRLASGLTQQLNDRYFGSRRASSCSGLPTTVASSNLRSVASFRLPRSYRTTEEERSGGEDDCVSFQPSSNWVDSPTDCDRTDDCDEDSESDLVKLDTNELLPRYDFCHPNATNDLAVNSHTSNAHFAGFDAHSDHSLSHSSHPSENTTVHSDQKRFPTCKPAFYFSVSALPAWARRKLSRRCSVSLVPPGVSQLASNQMERLSSDCDSQPGKQSNIADSPPDTRPNLPKSDLLTKFNQEVYQTISINSNTRLFNFRSTQQRILLDEDFGGSNDSLNVISKAVDVSSPCDKRRTDVMFRSEYHCPSESGSSHTRVVDSRNMRPRESRSTVSRDPSPRSVAISAPNTPFRRERSSAEYENSKLSIRQPKRQPPTSGANYTQSISTTSRSGAVRSQSTRVLRDTSPLSHPTGVSLDEDSLTTSRKTNWLRSSMSRVADERVRTSVCGGDSQYSSNLRKPSSMRSTVHSKSSVELSSNRSSCAPTKIATLSADSFTFLAMLDGDKPTVNSSPQDNLLVSRASVPLARFSIQTLEEIEERPLSQPSICREQSTDSSAEFGTLNSSCSNVATDPPPTHTLPMTSVADSVSDVSVICTKPTYTAPTYASRQKATHPTLQDLATMTVHPKIPLFTPSPLRKPVPAPTGSNKPNHISIPTDEALSRPTGKKTSFSNVSVKHTGALLLDTLHPEHNSDKTSLLQSDLVSPQLTRARWLPTPNSVTHEITSSMVPLNSSTDTTPPKKSRPTRPNDLLIARSPAHLTDQKFVTTLSSNLPSRPNLYLTTNSYQIIKNDPCMYSASQSLDDDEQADSSSHSKLVELDRFHSTRESLEAVQHALDLAVKRCAALKFHHSDFAADVRVNALRSVVTEELERRFAQLRAMLGLEPMCIAAPVARVLLADMVERLIPELHLSARPDRVDGHENLAVLNNITDREVAIRSSLTESTVDWVVDSTTESSSPHAQPNASKNPSKAEEEQS